ncbi:hypothetical protein G4G28_19335 [Massilia sp. Dwa41.01b]|uniref:hypothetical protein n=1 Tax=unclassified Massilia TaxID=2609279 RepID=UPI0016004A97|nr:MULTISPECIES: hypothetical protein [unclassified Massilia]QNA90112.1 hypothetical protein G4G28_19335 [Massilia sp. Dwa41.01b]QNB01001.1 hypothetical protein G4G31_22940 [Massilia sp. Se16.2.3]
MRVEIQLEFLVAACQLVSQAQHRIVNGTGGHHAFAHRRVDHHHPGAIGQARAHLAGEFARQVEGAHQAGRAELACLDGAGLRFGLAGRQLGEQGGALGFERGQARFRGTLSGIGIGRGFVQAFFQQGA